MQLPYKRLYLRIALYIAGAIVAFIALGVASLVLVASQELESYVATRHGSLGPEAAQVLAAGGRPALERWLRTEARVPADVTVYILDAHARDILGRPLPGLYADFIRESVVGPAEAQDGSFRPVRLAPQLVAPGGETYAFLVLPNRISFWGSPATIVGLLLVAVLVIGSVAWLIARAFGRPIGELQRAVRELASGHTDARVPALIASRGDELGALAADFNSMADQLEALLASRQRLMSELSHELRSPLARLQAALALAEHRGSLRPDEGERLRQEMNRMDRVIGDLLRFARLGAAAEIVHRLVALEVLLGELARDEEEEAASRGCMLELRASTGLTVVGDQQLLRSGLENVLRNAIRFAPRGSAVSIDAIRSGEQIEVSMSDRGPGVPPAHLERIFEPYFRVPDGAGPRGEGGTGLGLAIARRVLEVHGGGIEARAREGGGLTVTMRLPAAQLT